MNNGMFAMTLMEGDADGFGDDGVEDLVDNKDRLPLGLNEPWEGNAVVDTDPAEEVDAIKVDDDDVEEEVGGAH